MVTGSIRARVFICVSALVNLIGISVTCARQPGSVDSSFAGCRVFVNDSGRAGQRESGARVGVAAGRPDRRRRLLRRGLLSGSLPDRRDAGHVLRHGWQR